MLRFLVHYGIHFLVPVAIGFLFFKEQKIKVTLVLLAGIVIDIDHLWAEPIFDANRCSIGFHPLHGYWAISVYVLLTLFKQTRLIGAALLIHIIADISDCLFLKT
ncbi:DUF6122 family protein [Flagellimonas flava]|uniref:LexA-binding, inner membrane-associated hydrolase n=1 Tax=Flagellimonas flava TaxID=570519 RepID=A0A1M5HW86_9FLAO|nr:DUF6122 family protein [Allomuricauda flava]SHG20122.1 hypothetical protein SAMN04488116_0240 [Allomuricauda flava]